MRWLVIILFLLSGSVFSQDLSYSMIPDSLVSGAKAVIRYDSTWFTVESADRTSLIRKYAITILSREKNDLAKVYLDYDRFSIVKNVRARKIDRSGREIEKLKKKDMEDVSLFDGMSMASDSRAIYLNLTHNEVPYTIEISYEEQHTGTMFYPYWMPVSSYEESLEKGYFKVQFPSGNPVRFRERNIESVIGNDPGSREWSMANFPGVQSEPYSEGLSALAPHVVTAPYYFQVEGYAGVMDSWKSYGDWIKQLNMGRDEISPELAAKIRSLTDSLSSNTEKIAAVYKYMQQNTRYISIQLGIGGWQPFPASYVSDKSYGDCKALSNYTKALLKTISIPSDYALIRAGNRSDMLLDFPNAMFNHAILCVPNEGDTIWLECTSQTDPPGYQGTSTGNRHALVINEQGGHVVQTNRYETEDNLRSVKGRIELNNSGGGKLQASVNLNGIQIESGGFYDMIRSNSQDQEKWIKKYFDLKSIQLNHYDLDLNERFPEMPQGKIQAEFSADNLYNTSGSRLLINPNLFTQFSSVSLPQGNRRTDILKKYGYVQSDSLEIQLPPDYYPEYLPPEVEIQSEFGSYRRVFAMSDGRLIYFRSFVFRSGKYPSSKYGEFVDFIKSVTRNDNEKVIFLNKT